VAVDFLPEVDVVKAVSQSLAVLDLIMEPARSRRYYLYGHSSWGELPDIGSMRNGSGDEYTMVFMRDGAAYVRGFAHESPMSPWAGDNDGDLHPGLINGIPLQFLPWVIEPAFNVDGVCAMTVCLWTTSGSAGSWRQGEVPAPGTAADRSGAKQLFALVTRPDPDQYVDFARDYYQAEIDGAAVADVYARRPLDPGLVARINPERSLADLGEELERTGYPVA
jgi:hypothetical protein